MPLSYYIKNRIIDHDYVDDDKKLQIKELLDNIYTCCINGNIGKDEYHYKKINRKNLNYRITNDIKFTDINGKYSDDIEKNNLEIKKKILAVYDKKKILSSKFLSYSYFNEEYNALIAFDDNDDIYTILTYYYNVEKDCIEVHALWSNIGGGGIMMNFLINAIKCGISLCSNPANYKRELILYSVDDENTIDFYKKFNFIDNYGKRFFTRELSVGSVDLNVGSVDLNGEREILEDLDKEKNELYEEFEENNNSINNLNNKLQNLNNDLQYLSNITTRGEIDKTKNEIENLRGQQINVMDKLIQVLNKMIEIEQIEIKYKTELYDILDNTEIRDKITITEKNNKNLHFDKLINTIKETSGNNDFFKFVIQYLNNNLNYNRMDINRVLTGVHYEIEEEKEKRNELKLVKKLIKMKENSGGSIHKKQRKTRRKPNKKNKLTGKINKSKKHY
jgi:hypothetical protein